MKNGCGIQLGFPFSQYAHEIYMSNIKWLHRYKLEASCIIFLYMVLLKLTVPCILIRGFGGYFFIRRNFIKLLKRVHCEVLDVHSKCTWFATICSLYLKNSNNYSSGTLILALKPQNNIPWTSIVSFPLKKNLAAFKEPLNSVYGLFSMQLDWFLFPWQEMPLLGVITKIMILESMNAWIELLSQPLGWIFILEFHLVIYQFIILIMAPFVLLLMKQTKELRKDLNLKLCGSGILTL